MADANDGDNPQDDPAEGPEEMGRDRMPGDDDTSGEDAGLPELTLGGGAGGAEEGDEPERPRVAPTIRGKIDRFGVALGTGRRKTGVARVRLTDGNGGFVINGRPFEQYVEVERDRLSIMAVLEKTEMAGKVDISVQVAGGGLTGQTGAIILGIARALQAKNPALHPILSENDYLTRDPRMVERKKYGHKKARRSFQFSKR